MQTIDTKGQQCPIPIIAAKRALKNAGAGDSFKLVTDNETSFNNILRFLKDNNATVTFEESEGVWTLTITKSGPDNIDINPEEYCVTSIPHFSKGDFIIAVSSDIMGNGDSKLGHILMNNFIKAVKDLDVLPQKMVFYNRGVILGVTESPVVDHLEQIEKMGVGLLFCATCADYYSLRGKIKIGTMSNMFEIVQVMASASKIVNP